MIKPETTAQNAANIALGGDSPLSVSWAALEQGAIENGATPQFIEVMKYGYFAGAAACFTRAEYMMEQSFKYSNKDGNHPNDLTTEISDGLDTINTAAIAGRKRA